MRLQEATKGQMRMSGIDPATFTETTIALADNYGNIHLFDVDDEAIRPEKTMPHDFDAHEEEVKMAAYFGNKGEVKVVDGRIAQTFYQNHGSKSLKIKESMALIVAELQDTSAMAFRLGRAFRSHGAEVLVYKPFFYRAYRLIMEGE